MGEEPTTEEQKSINESEKADSGEDKKEEAE